MPTVLVVDDDDAFRQLVLDILDDEDYRLLQAADAETALRLASEERVDVVLSDQRMPGMSGIELARRLCAAADPPALVLMTAYGSIPEAVEAMRVGAVDYLTKPLESPQVLRDAVRGLLRRRPAASAAGGAAADEEFLTRDAQVLDILALADRAAVTDATVLITGESGTGKELLARRIHRRSRRSKGPFVPVNCAALPESLAESELFGHERGAFTGAQTRHRGYFEQAAGGSLFLDELAELSAAVQAKLLRVVERGAVRRLGTEHPTPVDVRLIAATNRDLEAEVAADRFRADLLYRLRVVSLRLPPLRERTGDIELLAERFIGELSVRLGVAPRPLSAEAVAGLREHSWPGNVRELHNVVERALIAATGVEIAAADLPILAPAPWATEGSTSSPETLKERERRAILEALEETGGHRERAAKRLGISVRTLYNRLKEFGIQ